MQKHAKTTAKAARRSKPVTTGEPPAAPPKRTIHDVVPGAFDGEEAARFLAEAMGAYDINDRRILDTVRRALLNGVSRAALMSRGGGR